MVRSRREPKRLPPDSQYPAYGGTSETLSATQRRKGEHIRINLEEDVQSKGVSSGLERYRLVHMALPELDLNEVDTGTTFLGHSLRAPILVSCMTGGVERGREINQRLARAAQAHGCAMGVGSQRAAIEDPALAPLFRVRDVAPDILLLANLGAAQLNYGYGVDHCRRAVAMIDAGALALHLNPLQEALQPEGNVNFSGLLTKIEQVCRALEVPVIVKEVGWGVSARVARQLAEAGVAAIDVAGAGGTSWSEVEHHRAPTALRRLGHPHGGKCDHDPSGSARPTADRERRPAQWDRRREGDCTRRQSRRLRLTPPPGSSRVGGLGTRADQRAHRGAPYQYVLLRRPGSRRTQAGRDRRAAPFSDPCRSGVHPYRLVS